MADQEQDIPKYDPDEDSQSGGTATKPPPKADKKSKPNKKPPGMLPPWKVLLHNDDSNDFEYVIDTVLGLTPLKEQEATIRTIEAHKQGVALLLVTHKERAELYEDQFKSKGLTVSIEPAE